MSIRSIAEPTNTAVTPDGLGVAGRELYFRNMGTLWQRGVSLVILTVLAGLPLSAVTCGALCFGRVESNTHSATTEKLHHHMRSGSPHESATGGSAASTHAATPTHHAALATSTDSPREGRVRVDSALISGPDCCGNVESAGSTFLATGRADTSITSAAHATGPLEGVLLETPASVTAELRHGPPHRTSSLACTPLVLRI